LSVQGASTSAQSMSIIDAQTRLNELGFDVGKPDGRIGPKTQAQIREFQQSRRIPVTGRLDQETIGELSK
jgi:peptidoglycan hydrolase-like protein with peptidoglycan-binding domain